jgi:hypothetical protein
VPSRSELTASKAKATPGGATIPTNPKTGGMGGRMAHR